MHISFIFLYSYNSLTDIQNSRQPSPGVLKTMGVNLGDTLPLPCNSDRCIQPHQSRHPL